MTESSPANVLTAYEVLFEKLRAEVDRTNRAGGRAFAEGKHGQAQELLAKVQQLASLRDDLRAWGHRLRTLLGTSGLESGRDAGEIGPVRIAEVYRRLESHKTRAKARPQAGSRTPEGEYRVPILTTLVEMAGSARMSVVLERVYGMMKDRLTEHDLALLQSGADVRWRNAAAWCRKKLCYEGLLRNDSPSGVWEISDKGRQWLRSQGQDTQH